MRKFLTAAALAALGVAGFGSKPASAVPIYWTDWQSETAPDDGFAAQGEITTGTKTISVTYENANGVGFFQDGSSGTNYWTPTDPGTSPYTSTGTNGVDNAPSGTDIIALSQAGLQTLTFSETVANPVFAFVSLNGNGYGFLNQDFEILSYAGGNVDGAGTDAEGFFGAGPVTKEVVDLGGGNFEYRLVSSSGEPHGAIRFTGAFDTLSWNSLQAEYWNGFTVGVQGSAAEVFATPLPAAGLLLLGGLGGFAALGRRRAV